ncbi:MAG: transposase [Byssovorax sp.]
MPSSQSSWGVYRLIKRQVPELMRDLFGLQMSVGAIIGCQDSASAAIAEAVENARIYVKQQPVKHADETGWREGVSRSRVWLWTVVTTRVVVFMIHARRNADAAKELLGKWRGVLVTDRHGAYHWWPNCRRQFCWAHLKRTMAPSGWFVTASSCGRSAMERIPWRAVASSNGC